MFPSLGTPPRWRRAESCASLGAKYSTPEFNTSEFIVDFQWHVPMDCQFHFIVQWYVQKDWHLPNVCLLEFPNELSVVFSNGIYMFIVCPGSCVAGSLMAQEEVLRALPCVDGLGQHLGGSKGSATKGQLRKCSLTAWWPKREPQKTRQGCATRHRNQTTYLSN